MVWFPRVKPLKEKHCAAIWSDKVIMQELWIGTVRSLPSQLTYPNSVTHQAIPHTSWGTLFQEDFFSIETPPLFLTKSSLVIIKISRPFPKVTSCRLKPEPPKNLPNTTVLHCKAPTAWKCADFTKKSSIKGNKIGQQASLSSFLPGCLPAPGWVLPAP